VTHIGSRGLVHKWCIFSIRLWQPDLIRNVRIDSLICGCFCCKRRVIFVFVSLFEVYLLNIGLFVKNTELIVSIDKSYAVIITIFRLIHIVDVDPVCLVEFEENYN
jgi:hypothetical protein